MQDLWHKRPDLPVQAIRVATSSGACATDSQLAEHHYRLGEVYWRMRGRYKAEKQFAYSQVGGSALGLFCVCGGGGPPARPLPHSQPAPAAAAEPLRRCCRRERWHTKRPLPPLPRQFLEAAKVEGHGQAAALAALGRYFEEVEARPDQARGGRAGGAARVRAPGLAAPSRAVATPHDARPIGRPHHLLGGRAPSAAPIPDAATPRAPPCRAQAARCYKKALALDPGASLAGAGVGQLLAGLSLGPEGNGGGTGAGKAASPRSPSSLLASPRLKDSARPVGPARA